MTEREKLLNRVRMYDFALVDVIEYLDGHPKTPPRSLITARCAPRSIKPPPNTKTHSAP